MAIPTNYIYPNVGFACTEIHEDSLYAVTSTQYPTGWIRQNNDYKCVKPIKKLIMKYNTITNNYTNGILTTNMMIILLHVVLTMFLIFYIMFSIINCPSNYNLDSSITGINLTDFTFIDNTLLKNIQIYLHLVRLIHHFGI